MNNDRVKIKKEHLEDASAMLRKSIAAAQKGPLDEALVETLLVQCERWLLLAADLAMAEKMTRKNERSKE